MKKVILLSDIQAPFEDKKTLKAVFNYMADEKWDEVIIIGDFMDIYSLSGHSEGKPGVLENHRLAKEYKRGNEILDEIQKSARKAKITYLEGNHEHRICRYLEKFPQLKGQIEVEINLRFKERKIKYIKCYCRGDVYQIGNAFFHHGLYTNEHHAKKMVSRYGVNIFYGHTHDMMCYSLVQRGRNRTLVGQSLGCLCRYDQSYIKGNPQNWQQGFGVFYFRPNGFFSYYTPRIFNNQFIAPNGKVYKP